MESTSFSAHKSTFSVALSLKSIFSLYILAGFVICFLFVLSYMFFTLWYYCLFILRHVLSHHSSFIVYDTCIIFLCLCVVFGKALSHTSFMVFSVSCTISSDFILSFLLSAFIYSSARHAFSSAFIRTFYSWNFLTSTETRSSSYTFAFACYSTNFLASSIIRVSYSAFKLSTSSTFYFIISSLGSQASSSEFLNYWYSSSAFILVSSERRELYSAFWCSWSFSFDFSISSYLNWVSVSAFNRYLSSAYIFSINIMVRHTYSLSFMRVSSSSLWLSSSSIRTFPSFF